MKKILTIAGSDCSGGAGIQADLKTMTAHKVYGMSVISMITAQNTTGIQDVFDLPQNLIISQIDSCFQDIFPDAVKTGALFNTNIIQIVKEKLLFYNAKNIVIDPVMKCTAKEGITECLLQTDAIHTMIDLFSVADIITPNIPEAEVLCSIIEGKDIDKCKIDNEEKIQQVCKILSQFVKNKCVLIKGGHFNSCNDCLYLDNKFYWFEGKKINTKNTHGTGCSLSAAIASNLAIGFNMIESVKMAKNYVYNAILNNPQLGKGFGPINHCWNLKK